jgi:hypothetical protein
MWSCRSSRIRHQLKRQAHIITEMGSRLCLLFELGRQVAVVALYSWPVVF